MLWLMIGLLLAVLAAREFSHNLELAAQKQRVRVLTTMVGHLRKEGRKD